MAGAPKVAIVGRSLRDLTDLWGQFQPFFRNADIIVNPDPVRRAFDTVRDQPGGTILVISMVEDCARLGELAVPHEGLLVVCQDGLYDRCMLEVGALALAVLRVEDAALALMGTERLSRRPAENRYIEESK